MTPQEAATVIYLYPLIGSPKQRNNILKAEERTC